MEQGAARVSDADLRAAPYRDRQAVAQFAASRQPASSTAGDALCGRTRLYPGSGKTSFHRSPVQPTPPDEGHLSVNLPDARHRDFAMDQIASERA